MDGQLAIRDETKSTSTAVAGPDQAITLPMESALLMAIVQQPQWEDKWGFWKNSGPAYFR
jgi:hypothetical protein